MAMNPTGIVALASALAMLGACAQQQQSQTSSPPAGRTILVGSTPANGSTVAGPVNAIELRFSPPARLGEVTVSGPDGLMPMMVTAVGEVGYYSLPVSLDAGSYTVSWAASVGRAPNRGSFAFTVR